MSASRDRLGAVALILLAGIVALVVYDAGRESLIGWEHNLTRLHRSFALAAGAELYPEPGTGVAILTLYPPLGAVAYLPATWLTTPSAAIAVGLGLSLVFLLLPVALLLALVPNGQSPHPRQSSPRPSALLWLLFVLIAVNVPAIDYVLFSVHVDAPTLGLALGACAAYLLLPSGGARLAITALLVIATMWTKQVGLFLAPSLALFAWLDHGRRTALTLVAWLAVWGLLSALLIPLLFGSPAHLFEHLVVLPSHHPWYFGGGLGAWIRGLTLALAALVSPLAIALASVLPWRQRLASCWRYAGRIRPWWLLWLTALLSLPTSILARIKEGGDINSFSAPALFLVVGGLLCLRASLVLHGEDEETQPETSIARAVVVTLVITCLVAALSIRQPNALRSWRQPLDISSLTHEVAFRYAKAHPGEAYFPRLAAVSYLAEGVLYPSSPGLRDLDLGGVVIQPSWVRSQLPAQLRVIGLVENGYQGQVAWLRLPDLEPLPPDPKLPGFALHGFEAP